MLVLHVLYELLQPSIVHLPYNAYSMQYAYMHDASRALPHMGMHMHLQPRKDPLPPKCPPPSGPESPPGTSRVAPAPPIIHHARAPLPAP